MSLIDFIVGQVVMAFLILAGCICSSLVSDDDEPTGDNAAQQRRALRQNLN